MAKPSYRDVCVRALRETGRIVIARSWKAFAINIIAAVIAIVAAFVFIKVTPADDLFVVTDKVTALLIAFASVVILAVGVFLAQLLFVAPFQLWRAEWERAEGLRTSLASLSGPGPVRDRVGLLRGLLFAVFHDWNQDLDRITADDQATFLAGELQEFVQAAHEGALVIWGRRQRHAGVHESIDAAVWTEQYVHWFSLLRDEAHTEHRSHGHMPQFPLYHNLLVSRSEVERLFGGSG